jgi:quinoprotein dehydrogenase-associated probable ABC transporter substrate-binding protein
MRLTGIWQPRLRRRLIAFLAPVLLFAAGPLPAQPTANAPDGAAPSGRPTLRVCQDPNNLPFSSRDLGGFENRIAALFAKDLGWDIAYTWFPQRMGFVRNTLRAREEGTQQEGTQKYKCDLVTGVADGFDMGATTRPYYHSTYAMAYVKGKGLDEVRTLQDLLALPPARRTALRIGVFGRSPVADWLLKHDMLQQIVTYQTQSGDPEQYPGQIIENDLANGKIDIAFVWGPIAAYFAKNAKNAQVAAIPLQSEPGMRFDFRIVMAVRYGEKEFKQRIDGLIERHRDDIRGILQEYGVPLIDDDAAVQATTRP